VTYRPAGDYFGPDRFVYSVTAPGSTTSVAGAVDLVVAPRPDRPTASDTRLTVAEDGAAAGVIAAADPDGDTLFAMVLAPPLHGSFTVAGLDFVYEPDPDFAGSDAVDVLVDDDGDGVGATARLSFEVVPVADVPVARPLSLAGDEDTAIAVRLLGETVDGDALSFVVVAPPVAGVVVVDATSGIGTYTPPADLAGAVTFDYVVVNAAGLASAPARASVQVRPVDDPPSLQAPAGATLLEDTVATIPFVIGDVDGDQPALAILTDPAHGAATVDVAQGVVSFSPAADFFGVDAVELVARDPAGRTSAPVRVSLTVLPVPDAPSATGARLSVAEDGAAAFALAGATRDAVDLDFFLVTPPAHGELEGFDAATGLGLYRPAADFSGEDSFRFGVRDAAGLTSASSAVVTIVVEPVADGPRLPGRPVILGTEDTVLDLAIPVSDPDGDLAQVLVSKPEHGTILPVTSTTFRYVPEHDYNGEDELEVTAVDGGGRTAVQRYTIRLAPVPDVPEAFASDFAGLEDQVIAVQLAGRSVDGDVLRFVLEEPPDEGSLASFNASNGAALFLPPADFSGTTSFSFRVVNTAGLLSAPARVLLEVVAVNDPPTLEVPTAFEILEDRRAIIRVDVVDADADDVVTIIVVTPPQDGALEPGPFSAPTRLQYTPAPDFHGTDFFSLQAVDASGAASATVAVRIDVLAVSDPPIALPQQLTMREDGLVPFALGGTTVDGGSLRFAINRAPARGLIEGFDAVRGLGTYRPAADDNGQDSFAFVAIDERGVSGAEAVVTIDVAAVNDLPTVTPRSIVTPEDIAVDIPLAVVDADADPTSLQIVANGSRGSATITSSTSLRYVPLADANGTDTLVIAARDGAGAGPSATITVTIVPVPDPPRATAVTTVGPEDATIIVSLAGTSADGEAVSFVLATAPTRGALESFNASTGVALYRGGPNFHGIDSFVFTARTATQTGTSATATVVVSPVNDAPTLAPPQEVVDVPRGSAASSPSIAMSDVDGDPTTLVVVAGPAAGSVAVVGDVIAYIAPVAGSDFVGPDTVAVVAVDAAGAASAPVDVTFRVVVDDDCASLRNSGVTASGIHAIRGKPARCDMTLDGGGWTMVAKVVDRWRYDDSLWVDDEPLNPESLEAAPTIDAKLEAWRLVPSPDALRVESFNLDLRGRQRILLDVGSPRDLAKLFAEEGVPGTTTTAGLAAWRTAFAPGEGTSASFSCLREGANLAKGLVEGVACRLCAIGGNGSSLAEACTLPVQAYGLGVREPLSRNAGATGAFDERRRAVLWVRSTDFSVNFPDAESCADHAARGRVVSGLYRVRGATTFCAF